MKRPDDSRAEEARDAAKKKKEKEIEDDEEEEGSLAWSTEVTRRGVKLGPSERVCSCVTVCVCVFLQSSWS